MKIDLTVAHVITLDAALLASLSAVLATITTGLPAMQTQIDQLNALTAKLTEDVAASVANSNALLAAIVGARGQIAALSAQVAALQAAGTVPDLQPTLDALAAADQTLADATTADALPPETNVNPAATPAA